MPQYLVKAPCAYVTAAGVSTHHFEAAVGVTVVELDDETAAALGDAVKLLVSGAAPDLVNPTPFPDAKVTRKRASDAEPTDG